MTSHAHALRRLFMLFTVLMLGAYLAALLQNWQEALNDIRARLTHINSMLVQGVRSTMKTHELVLLGFGSELVAQGALNHPENGRKLIEQMKSIDPEFAGFGLAKPDGQLVLVSNVTNGVSLPNLAQLPESRDSFLQSIAKNHIQLGRPYFMKALESWVSPIRVPIHNTKREVIAVMTAGYYLEHGSAAWANMILPSNVETALLRDDGYLQHLYPRLHETMEQTYGVPVASETLNQVKALQSNSGFATMYLPRRDEYFYAAYERLDEYGLYAASFVPRRAVLALWLERAIGPTLLLFIYFFSSLWAYRRSDTQQQSAENEVAKLTDWQQTLLDSAEYSIVSTDENGIIVSFNVAAQRMLGYRPEELIGKQTPDIFHDPNEVTRRALELSEELGRSVSPGFEVFVAKSKLGNAEEREWTYIRKDGTHFPVRLSVTALHGRTSEITGFMGIAADLTESKRAQTNLRDSNARYRTLFESAGDSIFLMEGEHFIDCNPATLKMFGCTREQIIGEPPYRFSPEFQPDGRSSKEKALDKIATAFNGEIPTFEWQHCRYDGTPFDAEVTLNVVEIGERPHLLATVRDVSERKMAEERIHQLAFHDPLTRLPNRQLLLDRLQQSLASSTRSGRKGALLFIDLDNFKTLNDTLGHVMGDLLLQQAAERLNACVREGDTVARLGGDEFVVILEDLSEQTIEAAQQTEVVGEKILIALSQTYQLDTHSFRSSGSIGANVISGDQQEVEELLKQTDIAMYQAKKAGRNTLRFFDRKMQDIINARAALESELHKALEDQQFHLYFQIQVDSSRRSLGAEALIRWIHPGRGIVPPAQFIPLAEETGLILPIGQWVLETACAQLKAWAINEMTRNLVLAVNISARQFHQPDFVAQVSAAIQLNSINPNLLKLELTESLLLEDTEDIVATMNALKATGVQLSLDDFGTGYSSLQYLKLLPLNQLKIDQSFVRDITTDSNDAAIVQTIIAMAELLGLDAIAEGVETEEQREFLELRGCHAYQGYVFGKPVPIEKFEELLKQD